MILRILGGFTLFTDVDGRAFTWYNEPNVKAKNKENYSYVPQHFTGLMKQLSRQGVPAKDDRELKADRFCLPVSVRINRRDREPDRDREVLETVLWGEWALQVRNNEEVKSRLLHFKSLVDGI